MDNFTRILKNSFIYALGNISRKAIGFVLLPLYLKKLSISDYGILGIMEISSQALIAVFGFGLYMALNRWYLDESYAEKQKEIVFSIISFLVIISVPLYLIIHFGSHWISQSLFSNDFSGLIRIVMLVSLLEIICQIFFTVMRLQEKAVLFTISNTLRFIFTTVITIYFIVFLKRGIEGIYLAQLWGIFFYLLLISFYIVKNLKPVFQWHILQEMLRYSTPLVASSISGIILMLTDRYLLKSLTDLSQVAVYNLAAKFANLIQVFIVIPISMSLTPVLYRTMNNSHAKQYYAEVFHYYSLITLSFSLILLLFSREILLLINPGVDQYWQSLSILPILVTVIFFGMQKDFFSLGLRIRKKTVFISTAMIATAIINIFLNLILIPRYLAIGAAIATMVSHLLLAGAMFFLSQNFYRIPYNFFRLSIIIFSIILIYFLSVQFEKSSLLIILKIALFGVYLLLAYSFRYFDKKKIAARNRRQSS